MFYRIEGHGYLRTPLLEAVRLRVNKAQLYTFVCLSLCVAHSNPSWRYDTTSSLCHFAERVFYGNEFPQWVNCVDRLLLPQGFSQCQRWKTGRSLWSIVTSFWDIWIGDWLGYDVITQQLLGDCLIFMWPLMNLNADLCHTETDLIIHHERTGQMLDVNLRKVA